MLKSRLSQKFAVLAFASCVWLAAAGAQTFEISVTNLTRDQRFTPILGVTHTKDFKLFTLGQPASAQLKTLAEEGDTAPFVTLLTGAPEVRSAVSTPPPPPLDRLTAPGKTTTFTIGAGGFFDQFSIAAMLIPTNDAFFAINGADLPKGNDELVLFAVAYDAGTEKNDELCSSIPGPGFVECVTQSNPSGNGGGGAVGGGEGFVHVHAGIHGVGNMNPATRDWRNPVARVTVRRTR